MILLYLLLIFVIFLLLAIILGFTFFVVDTFLDLPYVATKKEKVATIITLANIKPRQTVIDLGSGDGRLLFASAQKGARAIGYEINPYLVLFTRIKSKILKEKRVVVKKQSLWNANLKTADVIFVYGRGKTMKRFEDFVFKNAKKGARIIVNTDLTKPFPTKRPIKSEKGIYLYSVSQIY